MVRISAPLDFLRVFADRLRSAGIPFAITSGMACVHYGLQQTTKDSDWIIPAGAIEPFRELLEKLEGAMPPWRVSYRQVFGAPLDPQFMKHGWTSHLSIWDQAGSVEHKVDLFTKPPRVQAGELQADPEGWASRHVVAMMKRTDRDKDWPMVQSLGRQLRERNDSLCLLHLTAAEALISAWPHASAEDRARLAARRPLLRVLDAERPPAALDLERLLAVERLIWQRVNEKRYTRFTRAWKDFFRQWRRDDDWQWPLSEPFWLQHRRLVEAAHRHGLPGRPVGGLPSRGTPPRRSPGSDDAGARHRDRACAGPAAPQRNTPVTIHIVPAETEMSYSEAYYEWLASTLGEERAAWARLPREEREQELRRHHEMFNTPDDLALWPPELDGGVGNP